MQLDTWHLTDLRNQLSLFNKRKKQIKYYIIMMQIPKRYEDLTVDQFQQLELLKSEKLDKLDMACKRLSILTGKSIDYIESLSPTKVYDMLLGAAFLINPINQFPVAKSVRFGFHKFRYIKEIHEYTTAQQKDFTTILKNNGNDYIKCLPELMAICHHEFTIKGWVYNSDNHFRNVEYFKKSKLKDTLGAVFFYSNCLKSYSEIIEDCLQQADKVIQALMTEVQADSEFQTFLSSGGGNIPSASA